MKSGAAITENLWGYIPSPLLIAYPLSVSNPHQHSKAGQVCAVARDETRLKLFIQILTRPRAAHTQIYTYACNHKEMKTHTLFTTYRRKYLHTKFYTNKLQIKIKHVLSPNLSGFIIYKTVPLQQSTVCRILTLFQSPRKHSHNLDRPVCWKGDLWNR